MFAELEASEGRHALSIKGCYVICDRLLNILELSSCKPYIPLDSTCYVYVKYIFSFIRIEQAQLNI